MSGAKTHAAPKIKHKAPTIQKRRNTMRTIRITDNGYEITNVKPTGQKSVWLPLKDMIGRVLQNMRVMKKPDSTDDPKQRK